MTIELFFQERLSGQILWANGSFAGTGDYRITTVGVTEINRRNSIIKLAGDSAEKAYQLMMSNF